MKIPLGPVPVSLRFGATRAVVRAFFQSDELTAFLWIGAAAEELEDVVYYDAIGLASKYYAV
ncbi:hypothetical protein [Corynebacterium sp. SA-MJD20WY100]|uniref:hypothetical protein n=1 Tax=Corynebacterium sp. SA-MJD20WY100 TaxID=3142969 RepID=UPI003221DCB7